MEKLTEEEIKAIAQQAKVSSMRFKNGDNRMFYECGYFGAATRERIKSKALIKYLEEIKSYVAKEFPETELGEIVFGIAVKAINEFQNNNNGL